MAKCDICGKGVTFGIKVSHSHRRTNRRNHCSGNDYSKLHYTSNRNYNRSHNRNLHNH